MTANPDHEGYAARGGVEMPCAATSRRRRDPVKVNRAIDGFVERLESGVR